MRQRASERLAAIPEEEDPKEAKVMDSPTITTTPAPVEQPPPKTATPLKDILMKRVLTWDVVYEKNFYKFFFAFVYGLAIISYLKINH
jgi:hypothetical protein